MDLSPYVDHYLKESEKEEKKIDRLYFKLNKRVRNTVNDIGPGYDLDKIYLFGSLTDRETFHLKSDIDLAVSGLKSEKYLEFYGDLEKSLKHSFDLVDLDRTNKTLKEHILKEGEIIYDSQKEKS